MTLGKWRATFAGVFRRITFNNARFWNERYRTNLDIGSGPGSRAQNLVLKNAIIRDTMDKHAIRTILDIGCGDIAVLKGIDAEHYTGIDISEVIVERNKILCPAWTFLCADLAKGYDPPPADLVLCLDVLIHQKRRPSYGSILSKTISATKKVALISGYSTRPSGWNVFFHEPLADSIRQICPNARIEKLAEYRETDLLKVTVHAN
jgi:SAM-dependent methyltransferase